MNFNMNHFMNRKKRTKTILKNNNGLLDFKDAKDLQEDYETLQKAIFNEEIDLFSEIIRSSDMKYFLVQNDLDYNLFRDSVRFQRVEFIKELEKSGYKFNNNMLLIELYENLLNQKIKEKIKEDELTTFFCLEDFVFLIQFENGKLIDTDQCLLEFYFLILCTEYDLANCLISQSYAFEIKEIINQMFIGDENNLLEHILMNTEITKGALKCALHRQLDGVAYEIFSFSGAFLDETIMKTAVKNDCSLFLEEVWESTRKFGNVKNFYAPKISFSKYIEVMIKKSKYEMASEAIKNWYEAYKEENVFTILLNNQCEELLIDLIETASMFNYRIEFSYLEFERVVKSCYFLLKVILGKPMYKNFLNSETIQKNLVDALRKGQTVLPAIECYNLIEEHLLVITHIEKAGKVLLDFIKNPKKFTFCRYPLLLCCLVSEFMQKVKRRFPVYESFFDIIYGGFVKAGFLFASKIKDYHILEYHLQRRDIKNRTCLQIMSQNRIYQILHAHNIGGVIGKYWGGNNVQYGLLEMSSFTYMLRYNLFDEMSKFEDFAEKYNNDKQFYFNYYSYRDIVSIRYYFKEFYNYVLVGLYMTLIYLAVIDKELENTINGTYSGLSNATYWGSMVLVLNKVNSTIFFTYVNRWYIEIDSLFGEICFFSAIIFHITNLKQWFISPDDYINTQMADALLLSIQICYLWWRVIDSLKSTKTYGGFLRTVFVVIKKLFLLVVFIYCFVLAFTGIFNLLFNQYIQFSTYFKSFFFLIQAALQQYSLEDSWTPFLNFSLMFFIGVCALILCNLVIAYATRIYDDVDDNIEPEHRGNLIKLYEYLNWEENMGIFKFLHAPVNIIQVPFSLIVLFSDNKKYWTDVFTRMMYLFCSSIYFILLIALNTIRLPYVYLYNLIINPIQYGSPIRKILIWLVLGPVYMLYYYLLDIFKFWKFAYRVQKSNLNSKDNPAEKILEFKKLFSNLISDISERVDSEKKLKKFSIIELVSHWLLSMSTRVSTLVSQDENNRMHKRSLIMKKYRDSSMATFVSENLRTSHAQIFENTKNKISIFEHFTSILYFLTKFSDNEGFIDKDLAKNIFPKRNYYDDEYFEFLYYFNYKYFKTIISHFTKGNGEIRREMNKLRGVFKDISKTNEKFNKIKHFLINISKKDLTTLNLGISTINSIFAVLDNSLLNAESSEFFKKIMITTSSQVNKGKLSSTFQKPDADNKIINRLEDLQNKKD